jgi:hypothetical protein
MKVSIALGAALFTMASASTLAAPVTYAFDTVTSVSMDWRQPEIRGTEKDTGNPLQVSIPDPGFEDYRYILNRCVPMFLTALEKQGKYFLYVTTDTPFQSPNVLFVNCRLELRT